jgi:glycosyltransferase involved in cell wall biosynthesis
MTSVLGQKGVSLELIVVDDGSTDGTGAWLDQRAAEDRRIKIVHHARAKLLPAARNAGIARASAPWVAFCDDDDLWAPDKLVSQLRALEQNGAKWSCTGVVLVDERLDIVGHHRVNGGEVLSDLLAENLIPSGSSVVADLTLVRKIGGFDPSLRSSEDWEMWIRLAQYSPLVAVDRPLIGYRLGIATMSMNTDRMRTSRAIIIDRYARLAQERGIKSTEVRHERYLAKQLLRAGSGRKAASIFASLAIKHAQWRELPRAAAALVAPRWTDRLGTARAAAAVPPDWLSEAAAWLRPMRDGIRNTCSTFEPSMMPSNRIT